jgi:uncharacterized iron-regulated protein
MRHLCAALLPAVLLMGGCVPPKAPTLLPSAKITAGDRPVAEQVLLDAAAQSSLVCVGEQHDDPAHHRLQHVVLQALSEAAARDGRRLALGLEMLHRQYQVALDDYLRGTIDARMLARDTDWKRNWGFDFAMYQPMLHTAHEQRIQLIALNAPRALTRAVAREGLDALPDEVRASLPELDFTDQEHRAYFWSAMGFSKHGSPHGHGHGSNERFYAAQVIWDETMASSAAAWLNQPERRIMVIAGNGHCHDAAIPSRVRRRNAQATTTSILVRTGNDELPAHASSDFVVTLPE